MAVQLPALRRTSRWIGGAAAPRKRPLWRSRTRRGRAPGPPPGPIRWTPARRPPRAGASDSPQQPREVAGL
eukprot:163500-Prorocentrum_minimum.AAC.1